MWRLRRTGDLGKFYCIIFVGMTELSLRNLSNLAQNKYGKHFFVFLLVYTFLNFLSPSDESGGKNHFGRLQKIIVFSLSWKKTCENEH